MLKTNFVKFEKIWSKFGGSRRPLKTLRGIFSKNAIIQEPVGLLSWFYIQMMQN